MATGVSARSAVQTVIGELDIAYDQPARAVPVVAGSTHEQCPPASHSRSVFSRSSPPRSRPGVRPSRRSERLGYTALTSRSATRPSATGRSWSRRCRPRPRVSSSSGPTTMGIRATRSDIRRSRPASSRRTSRCALTPTSGRDGRATGRSGRWFTTTTGTGRSTPTRTGRWRTANLPPRPRSNSAGPTAAQTASSRGCPGATGSGTAGSRSGASTSRRPGTWSPRPSTATASPAPTGAPASASGPGFGVLAVPLAVVLAAAALAVRQRRERA